MEQQLHNYRIKMLGGDYTKWLEKAEGIFEAKIFFFFDIQMQLCLSITDMSIGLKYLQNALETYNKLESNYFARILVLNSRELVNSLNGWNINNNIPSGTDTDKLKKKAGNLIKAINKLIENNPDFDKDIRDKLIAHRRGKGHDQNRSAKKINAVKIMNTSDQVVNKSFILSITLFEVAKSLSNKEP